MKRSAIMTKPQRARKCKAPGCMATFVPQRMGQIACSPVCAVAIGQRIRLKQDMAAKRTEKAQDREKREALMTLSDWNEAVKKEFHRYIRLRDYGLPCICCGKPMEPNKPGGSVDAGHYLSVGSSKHLRFVEMNVNAQRKSCNRPGGADRGLFRAGMVAKYGEAAVAVLEADQAPRQYRIPDLKAMRDDYRKRANALAKALKDD